PRSTVKTRAGSGYPICEVQVIVWTFGAPGNVILKPSSRETNSVHSPAPSEVEGPAPSGGAGAGWAATGPAHARMQTAIAHSDWRTGLLKAGSGEPLRRAAAREVVRDHPAPPVGSHYRGRTAAPEEGSWNHRRAAEHQVIDVVAVEVGRAHRVGG